MTRLGTHGRILNYNMHTYMTVFSCLGNNEFHLSLMPQILTYMIHLGSYYAPSQNPTPCFPLPGMDKVSQETRRHNRQIFLDCIVLWLNAEVSRKDCVKLTPFDTITRDISRRHAPG